MEHSELTKELILTRIFNEIKEGVNEENAGLKDAVQWDEGEGGAGWIENDLGFVAEVYNIVYNNDKYIRIIENMRSINNVPEAYKYLLENLPHDCLLSFRNGIMNGGTGNKFFWKCVDKHRNGQKINKREKDELKRFL